LPTSVSSAPSPCQLGRRVAIFMTKSFSRLLRPLLDRLDPALPDDTDDRIRRSWKTCAISALG
jgi:hypothetical protein